MKRKKKKRKKKEEDPPPHPPKKSRSKLKIVLRRKIYFLVDRERALLLFLWVAKRLHASCDEDDCQKLGKDEHPEFPCEEVTAAVTPEKDVGVELVVPLVLLVTKETSRVRVAQALKEVVRSRTRITAEVVLNFTKAVCVREPKEARED